MRGKIERKEQLANKISEFKLQFEPSKQDQEEYHENPLLKLAKTTKKQKQQEKSDCFINQLVNKVTFNTSGNISKSALRRRKRKEKEQLKPKMDELFKSLPTDIENSNDNSESKSKLVNKIVDSRLVGARKSAHNNSNNTNNKNNNQVDMEIFVDSKKVNLNKPNPVKATGYKRIMQEESKTFNEVLKNPQFRASPFDALKAVIQQNMK